MRQPAGHTTLAALLLPLFTGFAAAGPSRVPRSDSYILAHGDSCRIGGSFEELIRLREDRGGSFLWARRAGSAYLVEDPRLLEEAEGFFAALDALAPEQEALARREAALGREDEELDEEDEAIDAALEARERDADARGVEAPPGDDLDLRRGRLVAKREDLRARERRLSEEERRLDRRSEDLEARAEAELWKLIDRAIRSGAARPFSP